MYLYSNIFSSYCWPFQYKKGFHPGARGKNRATLQYFRTNSYLLFYPYSQIVQNFLNFYQFLPLLIQRWESKFGFWSTFSNRARAGSFTQSGACWKILCTRNPDSHTTEKFLKFSYLQKTWMRRIEESSLNIAPTILEMNNFKKLSIFIPGMNRSFFFVSRYVLIKSINKWESKKFVPFDPIILFFEVLFVITAIFFFFFQKV